MSEGKHSTRIRLLNLLEELAFYEKKVAAIEEEMMAVMDDLNLGEILMSMKGVGPVIPEP